MVCTYLQLEAISTYLYVDFVGVRCDGMIHSLLSFSFGWFYLFTCSVGQAIRISRRMVIAVMTPVYRQHLTKP